MHSRICPFENVNARSTVHLADRKIINKFHILNEFKRINAIPTAPDYNAYLFIYVFFYFVSMIFFKLNAPTNTSTNA